MNYDIGVPQKLRTALTVCEWRGVALYTPAGVWNCHSLFA